MNCTQGHPLVCPLVLVNGLAVTVTGILFTVETSPVPQLIGCIPSNAHGSYLAATYVILMLYDGGELSIFSEKSGLIRSKYRFIVGYGRTSGICM